MLGKTNLLKRAHQFLMWQKRRWQGLPDKREMTARYWAFVEPVLKEHPTSFSFKQAEACLEPWLKSIAFSHGPLEDAWPWMPFIGIAMLEDRLSNLSKVFEYGAGGSSIFFASRVGELVSIEHDSVWFEATQKAMLKKVGRPKFQWRGLLAEPQKLDASNDLVSDDPLSYASSDESFAGHSFYNYASQIDQYPNEYFDVVLIDGRSRPSCFMHAVNKVKFGGYIILDNAERASYHFIEETAEKLGFEIEEIWSPGPYNDYCWRALFMRRTRRYYSLNELDIKLSKYLDFDKGVFVEAGANDGIRQSNTYYLEACRGWTGILVEPIPELYEACRRNRPNATVIHGALTNPEMALGQVKLQFAGLMSVIQGGMQSKEEELKHVQVGCEIQKLSSYEVYAPTLTLSNILDQQGITEIDFLSLDVEGFEHQALLGLDFTRHRPRYILVEERYSEKVKSILNKYYEVVDMLSHHDVLYRSLATIPNNKV
jgi:FkbM family methyltransferase